MRWWFLDDFREPDEPLASAAVASAPVASGSVTSAPAAMATTGMPLPAPERAGAPVSRRAWRERLRIADTRRNRVATRVARWVGAVMLGYYMLAVLLILAYRFLPPPITGVQLERRIEAAFGDGEYRFRRERVPYATLPRHVPRAVVAAEDGRFFQHWGFDLAALRDAGRDALEGGGIRGASTITQQLMKNLFGCTCRNPIRKLYDYALTPVAELILPKQRILELYLNNVEWGPGVFGIQAAARYHYGVDAANLSRSQAAGLAALLPNPLRRTTRSTAQYRASILRRMDFRGW